MTLFRMTSVACFLAIVLFPMQQASVPKAGVNKIVLRVLNGKSGKPIKHDSPSIWLGNTQHPMNPPTDSKGEIMVDIHEAEPREIRVMPNWYADCRFRDDHAAGMKVRYPLDEIIAKGVVAENVCGKSLANPVPGVLILYVRPRTLKEKWDL